MSRVKKAMSGLSAGATIAIVLLVVPLVLGIFAALMYYLYIPTWRLFLGFEGFWLPAAVLVIGGGVASAINIPIGIRVGSHRYALNLLGFGGPIAVSIYAATLIHPAFAWHHGLAWLICTVVYFVGTGPCEAGVRVSPIAMFVSALGLIAYQYYLLDMPVREVMWWGYTIQYASLIIPDVYRAFANEGHFSTASDRLSFGGAGARDALWTAPLSVLTYCFLAQWLLWGGLDAAGK